MVWTRCHPLDAPARSTERRMSMHKCMCVKCNKIFMTPVPSWWCDDCRKKDFEMHQKKKPQTNADRIRAFSDKGLAELLIQYRYGRGDYVAPNGEIFDIYEEAEAATMEWLQQPAMEKKQATYVDANK